MPQWKQYSGTWPLAQQMQAVAAGTWTGVPLFNLYSWGDNTWGGLGLNNKTFRSSPVQVGSDGNWLQVVAGGYNNTSGAIKTNNTLWMWGYGSQGQLGLGNAIEVSSPTQVGVLSNWSQLSTGRFLNTLAIKTDGTLWAWGYNGYGQLGLDNRVSYSSPVQVGSGTNWAAVQVANARTIAIKTDGTMWAWGYNGGGNLGLGDIVDRSSPVQIGALTTWSKISGAGNFSIAIKTDGTMWSWGVAASGVLGDNTIINKSSPVQIGALTTWSEVSAGFSCTIAKKTDGTIWAWGQNSNYGQLGLNDLIDRSSPVQIGTSNTWLTVCATYRSGYGIKTDGTLWAWGQNETYGSLGLGDVVNRSSPTQVGSATTWTKLSTYGGNAYHMLAISQSTT